MALEQMLCQDNIIKNSSSYFFHLDQSPDIPECLRRALALIFPAAILTITITLNCITVMFSNKNKDKRLVGLRSPWLFAFRIVLTLGTAVIVTLEGWTNGGMEVYHIISTGILIANAGLRIVERMRGCVSSGCQFFFWLAATLTFIPTFKGALEGLIKHVHFIGTDNLVTANLDHISHMSQFALTLAIFLLEFFPDSDGRDTSELSHSFSSRVTFSWMDPVLGKGSKVNKSLATSSFPSLAPSLTLKDINARFCKTSESSGILLRLVKANIGSVLSGMVVKFVSDALLYTVPQVLRLFIRALESGDLGRNAWTAYFFGVITFGISVLQVRRTR